MVDYLSRNWTWCHRFPVAAYTSSSRYPVYLLSCCCWCCTSYRSDRGVASVAGSCSGAFACSTCPGSTQPRIPECSAATACNRRRWWRSAPSSIADSCRRGATDRGAIWGRRRESGCTSSGRRPPPAAVTGHCWCSRFHCRSKDRRDLWSRASPFSASSSTASPSEKQTEGENENLILRLRESGKQRGDNKLETEETTMPGSAFGSYQRTGSPKTELNPLASYKSILNSSVAKADLKRRRFGASSSPRVYNIIVLNEGFVILISFKTAQRVIELRLFFINSREEKYFGESHRGVAVIVWKRGETKILKVLWWIFRISCGFRK